MTIQEELLYSKIELVIRDACVDCVSVNDAFFKTWHGHGSLIDIIAETDIDLHSR